MLVLPTNTKPASRKRAASHESASARKPEVAQEAHALVVRRALTAQTRSLTTNGTPRNGPSAGSVASALLEQRVDHRVELAVERLDALDRALHELARRHLPGADEVGLGGGVEMRIHGARERNWPAGQGLSSESRPGFGTFRSAGAGSRLPPEDRRPWNRSRPSRSRRAKAGRARSKIPRSSRTSRGTSSRSSSASSTTSTTRPRSSSAARRREDQFIGFRLKQGVYGQRQADVQMIRVKLPFGGITPGADGGVRGRGREVRAAQQGPHHHAPEHPAPPHPAARRRGRDPRAVGLGPVEPRGLRQHGPQRDRRPVGRRLRGRALRPDALRRRLRALLRPPPHHAADAAQGQDGLHRDRRGPRDHRHPRRRLHPAHPRRREGLRDARRRRHVDHAARRAHAARVRRAPTTASTSRSPRRCCASSTARSGCAPTARGRASRSSSTSSASRSCSARSTRSSRATGSPSATSTPPRCCSSTTRRRAPPASRRTYASPNGDGSEFERWRATSVAPAAPGRLLDRPDQGHPRRPHARAVPRARRT